MGMIKKEVTGNANALKYVKAATGVQAGADGGTIVKGTKKGLGKAADPYAPINSALPVEYNLSRQFMAEGTKMQENANTTGGHNAKVPTGVYSIAKGRSKF